MKRLILSLPAAAIAFALGLVLVPNPSFDTRPPHNPIEPVELPIPISTAGISEPSIDFEPEFRDLEDRLGPNDHKIKLIDVGLDGNAYRKSEVIAKNGERWVGLFEENGETHLREVTTKVRFDPTYEGYGDEEYMRLTTDQPRLPHILLRDARRLKPGPIETSYLWPSWIEMQKRGLSAKEMKVGFKEDFGVGDNFYTLRVARGLTKSGEKVNVLVLEFDGVTQVVTYNDYISAPYTLYESVGYLHWAGDLDRDGKLDLYIQHFGYEKGGFSSSLFLSSKAGKGELVKEAAWFGTAGC